MNKAAIQLHYQGFKIAQANQLNQDGNDHDSHPNSPQIVSVGSDNWEENVCFHFIYMSV